MIKTTPIKLRYEVLLRSFSINKFHPFIAILLITKRKFFESGPFWILVAQAPSAHIREINVTCLSKSTVFVDFKLTFTRSI